MTHAGKIAQWIGSGKIGTEIGPGTSPVPGLDPAPIYIDCFTSFGAAPCRADYFGHACALPFHDHSLDYVVASHVLEHVANPVAALAEWYRVLRPGGIIYLVVPDRRATWEHQRPLTRVDHMLEDHVRGTTAADATHIDEFVFEADWSIFSPQTKPEDIPAAKAELARTMHWAVEHGQDINIHFHTFEPSNVRELLVRLSRGPRLDTTRTLREHATNETAESPPSPGLSLDAAAPRTIPRFNWDLVDFAERFPANTPNGVLAILHVSKTWRERAEAELFRLRTQGNPRAMLRDDAQPFAEWAAKSGPAQLG
jgi:SAM-dependent methyltransferase